MNPAQNVDLVTILRGTATTTGSVSVVITTNMETERL